MPRVTDTDVREPFDGQRNESWRPEGRSEPEIAFFVRRGEYAVVTAEVQVSWLSAAYPLRKECYTLERDVDGVVSVIATRGAGCRLTTTAVSSSVSLWGAPGELHVR